MRCLERLFRRAGLPLGFSEGFHPKPRMTFPSALAVGIEGSDEVMELELTEAPAAAELLTRLAAHAPPGLVIRGAEVLPPGSKKAQVRRAEYRATVPPRLRAGLEERIGRLLASSAWPVPRPRRAPVDVRAGLEELALRDGVLHLRLRCGQQGGPGPREVLSALGLADAEHQGVRLTRTAVELAP